MLHKAHDCKGSVVKQKKKTPDSQPQEAWCQDEMIGSKQPVIN
jgi:hypothetical protein